jgi:hypothetical protein
MKRKRLLKTLTDMLDMEGYKQRKHRDELKILLKKLRKKEVELKEKLQLEKDVRKQKRLKKECDIVKAQRTKGVMALRGLKKS